MERSVKQDQDSCQNVRENIPECEAEGEAGQTEAGDQRRDIDAQCAECGDRTEDDQRDACNATQQIQKVACFIQPVMKTSDDYVNDLRGDPETDKY